MSSAPPPSAPAGPRLLSLPQAGRGLLFLQVMFGIALLMSVRAILFRGDWLAPTGLLIIGGAALVLVHRIGQLSVREVALHEQGLVVVRRSGGTFLPWSDVVEVRRDVGPDAELAYVVRLSGDRLLRLRSPGRNSEQVLQAFVERMATQAGFAWANGRAQRAA